MDLESFFGPEGPLALHLPGYVPREGQLEMAKAVAVTLRSGGTLLAEAGTGTGKTLAYLVPALQVGKKVVVSTATKTLQSQLLEKDIPLLGRAFGGPVSAVLLKGRQNYLCLRRFERFRAMPLFKFARDAAHYATLERWAGATDTGDRAELEDVPEDYSPWGEVCSTAETCWGSRCPREEGCHLLRHRRAAQRAQIVIVNHHLFFADLAVRSASGGEVLPRFGAAIFDEAHHLEGVATQFFGARVSSYRVAELVRDAAALAGAKGGLSEPLAGALDTVTESAEELWKAFAPTQTPSRLRKALAGPAGQRLAHLLEAFDRWTERLAPRQAESQEAENLFRRTGELRQDLARFATDPLPGEVRWLETRGRGVFLQAAPVEVGPSLAPLLFGSGTPAVLTSATLRAGDSFEYVRSRLGIPSGAKEVVVGSPFDFQTQALLYIPKGLPEPNDASFPAAAASEIRSLLDASQGRAFCLFTSHRVLQSVARALRGEVAYRLLVQGEAPREALLRAFQEDVHSVLLGAQAFWEGVDVPGEALSAVIIDRLPFASPSEPLVEARIEVIRSRGEAPFGSYQLPSAAMALRQGVGRLIRRLDDRGVVAILDRRFVESSYAGFLRQSLPPLPLTRDPHRVTEFFAATQRP